MPSDVAGRDTDGTDWDFLTETPEEIRALEDGLLRLEVVLDGWLAREQRRALAFPVRQNGLRDPHKGEKELEAPITVGVVDTSETVSRSASQLTPSMSSRSFQMSTEQAPLPPETQPIGQGFTLARADVNECDCSPDTTNTTGTSNGTDPYLYTQVRGPRPSDTRATDKGRAPRADAVTSDQHKGRQGVGWSAILRALTPGAFGTGTPRLVVTPLANFFRRRKPNIPTSQGSTSLCGTYEPIPKTLSTERRFP